MTNKKFIYVDKDLADEFEKAQDEQTKEFLVRQTIAKRKISIQQEIESLQDAELQFRAIAITHKATLEKAYKEQADLLYKLWEEAGDINSTIHNQTKNVRGELEKAKKDILELNKSFEEVKKSCNIESYSLEKIKDAVESYNSLSLEGKKMLSFLAENYRGQNDK